MNIKNMTPKEIYEFFQEEIKQGRDIVEYLDDIYELGTKTSKLAWDISYNTDQPTFYRKCVNLRIHDLNRANSNIAYIKYHNQLEHAKDFMLSVLFRVANTMSVINDSELRGK